MNKSRAVYIDILCFILGPFLIAFNLFDFNFGSHKKEFLRGDYPPVYTYYFYYKESTQILIAFGVALVCCGFLRHYWEKNERINK